jgi:hypothetical protein
MRCYLLLVLLSITLWLSGKIPLSWDDLYDVTFETMPGDTWACPTFGSYLKTLDGQEVYLTGYVLPTEIDENQYYLSANTFASCFFCGQAGPESVMELELRTANRNYRTDEWLRFKGILRLNDWDRERLYYILEEAEEY